MKITSVSVKKLYTYGNYENISFGYTADVQDGEDVEGVKKSLLARIEADYQNVRTHDDAISTKKWNLDELGYEVTRKEREARELEDRINKMLDFLKEHGVDVTSFELPF